VYLYWYQPSKILILIHLSRRLYARLTLVTPTQPQLPRNRQVSHGLDNDVGGGYACIFPYRMAVPQEKTALERRLRFGGVLSEPLARASVAHLITNSTHVLRFPCMGFDQMIFVRIHVIEWYLWSIQFVSKVSNNSEIQQHGRWRLIGCVLN
jgi:hypothetical protein